MYQLRSRPRSRSAGFLRDILRFFETCQTFLDNSLAHVRVSFASISFLQVPPSFLSRYSLVSLASFVVSLVLCVLSGLVLPCATSASFSLTPCTWHPVASHSQWVPLPPIHVPWVHMHNAHACNHKSQAQLTNCITRFMSLCVLTLLSWHSWFLTYSLPSLSLSHSHLPSLGALLWLWGHMWWPGTCGHDWHVGVTQLLTCAWFLQCLDMSTWLPLHLTTTLEGFSTWVSCYRLVIDSTLSLGTQELGHHTTWTRR